MSIVHRCVAGISVHKKIIWVAVPVPGERMLDARRGGAFRRSLQKMVARLDGRGVADVAAESTSAAEIGQSTPTQPDRSYVIQVHYPDLRHGQSSLSWDAGL